MLHKVDVELCKGIVMVLALVTQRVVEGEHDAAVLVFAIGRIIDMVANLFLRQGAAPDTEIVDHGLAAIVKCIMA